MKAFGRLYAALDATGSTLAKVDAMAAYFAAAPPADHAVRPRQSSVQGRSAPPSRYVASAVVAVEALSAYMIDQAFTLALVQSSGLSVISNSVSGVGLSRRGHLLLSGATLEN